MDNIAPIKETIQTAGNYVRNEQSFKVDDIYDTDGIVGRQIRVSCISSFIRKDAYAYVFVGAHMCLCVSDLLVSRCS